MPNVSKPASERLFICDPVCALPFGHNAVALNYFKNALSKDFSSTVALCGKELPDTLSQSYEFTPFFEHYYDEFVPIERRARIRADVQPLFDPRYVDHLEAIATSDATRLLEAYEIGAKDTIFYPSADFYGLIGFLNALATRRSVAQPRILLRFIGVMEYATHAYRDPLQHLVSQISETRAQGVRFSFSAETPRLAVMLSAMLDAPVLVTPYPEMAEPLPPSRTDRFIFFCPGSARLDKGFLHLQDVFTKVRRQDVDLEMEFVTQGLAPRDADHHQDYLSHLYAIPGVELLPASITSEEIKRHYQNCSAVLLPYDVETYRNRGSAVLMESACLARPVITVAGTAFAEQVSYYGLGTVVESLDALPAAMIALAKTDRRKLERQSLHARHRFALDVMSAYENWFRSGQ